MRTLLLTALVVVALSAHGATAQSASTVDLSVRENRSRLAKDLLSTFEILNGQIPELSPSQREWIDREYHQGIAANGGRYNARALAATNSAEYRIYIAKPKSRELVALLQQLHTYRFSDRNSEIALWSAVAERLIDYQYWQAIGQLVEAGRIEKKIGRVDSFYFENHSLQAQEILSRIVTPHLQGKLQ